MATKDYLTYKMSVLRSEGVKIKKKLAATKQALEAMDHEFEVLDGKIDGLAATIESYESALVKKYERVITKMQEQIAQLEKQIAKGGGGGAHNSPLFQIFARNVKNSYLILDRAVTEVQS